MYWNAVDMKEIRIIDGSKTHELNSLAISPDGEMFVSGGADKIVKVWFFFLQIEIPKKINFSQAASPLFLVSKKKNSQKMFGDGFSPNLPPNVW